MADQGKGRGRMRRASSDALLTRTLIVSSSTAVQFILQLAKQPTKSIAALSQ